MNEIELKARVADRAALRERLNSFAEFSCRVVREDSYYASASAPKIKIRIRKEIREGAGGKSETFLLTYKRKENKVGAGGIQTEVNDERECSLSSPEPLELFLGDSGCVLALFKRKDVEAWKYFCAELNLWATLELCRVDRLGDFLEIEILSEEEGARTLSRIQSELLRILAMCGIDESSIETKYYSQLLEEQEQGENHV